MSHENPELKPIPSKGGDLVTVDANIAMEEIAAIKVARVEENLLSNQMKYRELLKDKEQEHLKLQEKFPKAIDADTREAYPEIVSLESSLKSLFGKTVHMAIQLHGDKVHVSFGGMGVDLVWKGSESKAIEKQMKALYKDIKDCEDKLCEIKKGLGMLPFIERRAKAAVAEQKLSKSKEGQDILKSLDKLMLPGLPGLPASK